MAYPCHPTDERPRSAARHASRRAWRWWASSWTGRGGDGGGTGTATMPSDCVTGAWPSASLTASRALPWVTHLVEGLGEVLQQVQAVRDLDRLGSALPGPIGRGSKPIPGDHADAGMACTIGPRSWPHDRVGG